MLILALFKKIEVNKALYHVEKHISSGIHHSRIKNSRFSTQNLLFFYFFMLRYFTCGFVDSMSISLWEHRIIDFLTCEFVIYLIFHL